MEQPKIRRVQVAEPADVWFRVTTDTDRIKIETIAGHWSVVPSAVIHRLAQWAGPASIVGGVIWIALFLLLELLELLLILARTTGWNGTLLFVYQALSFLNVKLLALPMLLFLIGLLGVRTQPVLVSGFPGKLGFRLACAGLGMAIVMPFLVELLVPKTRGFDGFLILNSFCCPTSLPPVLNWYTTALPGLLILSIGMVLLTIEALRAKTSFARVGAFMTISLLAIHLVPRIVAWLGPGLGVDYYDIVEYQAGIFAGLSVLFGANWVLLGYSLRRESSNALNRTKHAKI